MLVQEDVKKRGPSLELLRCLRGLLTDLVLGKAKGSFTTPPIRSTRAIVRGRVPVGPRGGTARQALAPPGIVFGFHTHVCKGIA